MALQKHEQVGEAELDGAEVGAVDGAVHRYVARRRDRRLRTLARVRRQVIVHDVALARARLLLQRWKHEELEEEIEDRLIDVPGEDPGCHDSDVAVNRLGQARKKCE